MIKMQVSGREMAERPIEGKWFLVEPASINRELFAENRCDPRQESIRNVILQVFTEVDANPQMYGKAFETMMPEKKWNGITVMELANVAIDFGGHIANRVQQVLEWAQRIANGEPWEVLCNQPDTANWYRVVEWSNAQSFQIVGGSRKSFDSRTTPTDIGSHKVRYGEKVINSVPLIARYVTSA